MACFVVLWRLKVEINIPHDALLTGYFVSENKLANACASTTIFPKTDTVALALWASICHFCQRSPLYIDIYVFVVPKPALASASCYQCYTVFSFINKYKMFDQDCKGFGRGART